MFALTCCFLPQHHRQKRVRFPKGKKAKQGDNTIDGCEDKPSRLTDARAAAKERLERRNQIKRELIDEEIEGEIADISRAEVEYEVCYFQYLLFHIFFDCS